MITHDELVSDILRYNDNVSQLYFLLEVDALTSDIVQPQKRKDIETTITALTNSISRFNRDFREESSDHTIQKISQIQANLNSQTPQIVKSL